MNNSLKDLKDSDNFGKYKNDITAPNAIIFGDSFIYAIAPIFMTSFKNSTSIYSPHHDKNSLKIHFFKNTILKNNPQVLVVCIRNILYLKDFFDKNEE